MTSEQKQAKDEGRKAGRARFFAEFILSGQSEILRGVYPERAERDSSLRSE
jgi:hypothetical protein